MHNDTIVALATPSGSGAIAVVRLSGNNAIAIVDAHFKSVINKKSLVQQKTHTIHLGHIVDEGRTLDEVLISIFNPPRRSVKNVEFQSSTKSLPNWGTFAIALAIINGLLKLQFIKRN